MCLLRTPISSLLASLIVLVGCSGSGEDPDTYLRFSVEGQQIEIDHVIFGLLSLPKDGWQFLDIGQDAAKVNIVTTVPSANLQWRMKLDDPAALEGRTIDLDKVNDPEMATPIAMFDLTEDISVYNSADSTVTVTISRVSTGFVDGTFVGNELSYVSDTSDIFKTVDVSGSFRARIVR